MNAKLTKKTWKYASVIFWKKNRTYVEIKFFKDGGEFSQTNLIERKSSNYNLINDITMLKIIFIFVQKSALKFSNRFFCCSIWMHTFGTLDFKCRIYRRIRHSSCFPISSSGISRKLTFVVYTRPPSRLFI